MKRTSVTGSSGAKPSTWPRDMARPSPNWPDQEPNLKPLRTPGPSPGDWNEAHKKWDIQCWTRDKGFGLIFQIWEQILIKVQEPFDQHHCSWTSRSRHTFRNKQLLTGATNWSKSKLGTLHTKDNWWSIQTWRFYRSQGPTSLELRHWCPPYACANGWAVLGNCRPLRSFSKSCIRTEKSARGIPRYGDEMRAYQFQNGDIKWYKPPSDPMDWFKKNSAGTIAFSSIRSIRSGHPHLGLQQRQWGSQPTNKSMVWGHLQLQELNCNQLGICYPPVSNWARFEHKKNGFADGFEPMVVEP